MKRIITNAIVWISALLILASCANLKKIVYFQDLQDRAQIEQSAGKSVVVAPSDKLTIVVHSKDPELAAIFNLPIVSHAVTGSGSGNGFSYNGNNQISAYTVDDEGCIDLPVLGKVKIAGMTRTEVAAMVKGMIISQNLIKDPIVVVEYAAMYVSVLGDVNHPGRVSLDKDRFTLVDAITKAGDMNITAYRDNVKVYREENGRQTCYVVDFTKAENVFNSPVYYLKQDDVIYVEPNKMKVRQSTVNGNTLVSTSFWISVASLLMTVATFFVNITRK